MTVGGQCRFCGKHAGFFRSIRGTSTVTRRGAEKVLKKEQRKRNLAVGADLSRWERESMKTLDAQGLDLAAYSRAALWNMTWQEAEILVWEWMRDHGHPDADLTQSGADGGVDVVSRRAVAQVKHHAKPVGISFVQRLAAVANAERKAALFFSCSGYTAAARSWAETNGVQCFVYPPVKVAPKAKGSSR